MEAAQEEIDAALSYACEDDRPELEFIRARMRWALAVDDLVESNEGFTEELEQRVREAQSTMAELGQRRAKHKLAQKGMLTKVPAWHQPMADCLVTGMARLVEAHEYDPEILQRPAEIVHILQTEASLARIGNLSAEFVVGSK